MQQDQTERCNNTWPSMSGVTPCLKCGTGLQVKIKKDAIFLKCKACGHQSTVDMRHKLNTYILKNPPEEKVSKAEKK